MGVGKISLAIISICRFVNLPICECGHLLIIFAKDILPTPILEGKDVIEFYNKLANFKKSFEEKGITREVIREDAKLLKSIFKERPDVEKK